MILAKVVLWFTMARAAESFCRWLPPAVILILAGFFFRGVSWQGDVYDWRPMSLAAIQCALTPVFFWWMSRREMDQFGWWLACFLGAAVYGFT